MQLGAGKVEEVPAHCLAVAAGGLEKRIEAEVRVVQLELVCQDGVLVGLPLLPGLTLKAPPPGHERCDPLDQKQRWFLIAIPFAAHENVRRLNRQEF